MVRGETQEEEVMTQLTIEMIPADTSKMIRPVIKTARTYRFDTKPACLVDQVALTTDYKKSEFVADSIKLGALIVHIAGADVLKKLTSFDDSTIEVLQKIVDLNSIIETVIESLGDRQRSVSKEVQK